MTFCVTFGIGAAASAEPTNHETSSSETTPRTAPAPASIAWPGCQVTRLRSDEPIADPASWPIVAKPSTMPTAKIAWPRSSETTVTIFGAAQIPTTPPSRNPVNAKNPIRKPCR